MKKRIVSSLDISKYYHRWGVTLCPHCDKEIKSKVWKKTGYILAKEPVQYKHGYVGIVSECPKCFESSWCHFSIPFFEYDSPFNKTWIKAANKVHAERCLEALRDWKRGICGECKFLEKADINTHTWRTCKDGCGPSETECKSFKKIKT